MKRRDLLKIGAAATVASQVVGAAGCVPLHATPAEPLVPSGGPSADEFLANLDRQLASMQDAAFVRRIMKFESNQAPTPKQQAMLDEKDAMFRKMLRTLVITQGFRDQSVEMQLAPAVQARMFGHLDEVGTTVFEVSDMLAALDDSQHSKLKQALKSRPDLPMTISAAIDSQAASAGVSMKRRLQLRQMMANATFRLRHGDPRSLIEEYTNKVERIRANSSTDALALDISQKLGERAFWQYQQQLAQQAGQAGGATMPATAAPGQQPPGSVTPFPPGPGQPAMVYSPGTPGISPHTEHAGNKGLRAGGYMMGIGVVVFGFSALLVDASFGFVIGMTVGAIAFAIGFVTLVISALIYWAN